LSCTAALIFLNTFIAAPSSNIEPAWRSLKDVVRHQHEFKLP
jgi:hypothetical protein